MNQTVPPRPEGGREPAADPPRISRRPQWFGLFLVVVVVAAALAAIAQTRSLHLRALEQNLASLTGAAAEVLESWTYDRLEQVLGWAANPAVRAIASQPAEAGPDPQRHAQLAAALRKSPDGAYGWSAIALVSSRRQNLYTWGLGADGAASPLADHGDLLRLVFMGQSVIAPFWLRAPAGGPGPLHPLIIFAAPVSDGEGRVLAALIMAQAPAGDLARHLEAWRLGRSGHLMVFDRQGRVILDNAPAPGDGGLLAGPGPGPGPGRGGADPEAP
ncbi:MAG: cache domain-containing protein, partial [Pseudomonadota bacterium]